MGSTASRQLGAFDAEVFTTCSGICRTLDRTCFAGCFNTDNIFQCTRNCDNRFTECLNDCSGLAGGNVNSTATVSDNGRHLVVTGPITCTEGLRIQSLAVTVTQRGIGAVAHGHTHGRCTGEEQQFSVNAKVRGSAEFLVPGVAEVCAAPQIGIGKLHTDSIQWCNEEVLLVPEE